MKCMDLRKTKKRSKCYRMLKNKYIFKTSCIIGYTTDYSHIVIVKVIVTIQYNSFCENNQVLK